MKRQRILIVFIVLASLLITQLPVFAGHSSTISDIRVCVNGVTFTGTATEKSALGLSMLSQIMDVNTQNVLFTGNSYTFTSIGDVAGFSISYPAGTFAVGTEIIVSLSDIPGTIDGAEGDGQFVVVEDCRVEGIDGRICFAPGEAPVAVYPKSSANGYGIEIWQIVSADQGVLVAELSAAELAEFNGVSENTLITSVMNDSVQLYKLSSGAYQINAGPFGETKILVCRFGSLPPASVSKSVIDY